MALLSPEMIILLLASLLINGSQSRESNNPSDAPKSFDSKLDLDVAANNPRTTRSENRGEYPDPPHEDEFSSFFHEDFEDDPVFSTLFADPVQNDALLSPEPKSSSKREEYYDSLSKKAENAFPSLKAFKSKPAEDLEVEATVSDYYVPPSSPDYRRPYRLPDYDEYFPKRNVHGDKDFTPTSRYPVSSYEVEYPIPERPQQSTPYRNPVSAEVYSKPYLSHTPRKYYPKSRSPTPTTVDHSKHSQGRYHPKYSPPSPLKSTPVTYRPVTTTQKMPKYKKSSDTHARYGYSGSDFPSKPSAKSYRTKPTLASEEGRLFLSGTNYGKPVREQFHEQGTTGPHSYKFGYNTGDKDNPMARYEERGPDGVVKGSYSFVNPLGELKVVRYESHPVFGFRTSA